MTPKVLSSLLFIISVFLIGSSVAKNHKLQFNQNGTFKIIQFTDLHYGETPFQRDINSSVIQEKMLLLENPDIVVMTGDMVSGYAWDGQRPWFTERYSQLVGPMIKHGFRWAYTLGNHDDEADLNRRQIVDFDMSFPLSLTKQGPEDIHGATNYHLPVLASNDSTIIANLWMFDSSDTNCLGVTGWGCVYPDQVEWYRQESMKLKEENGRIIPGLSFFHIPNPEFMNMWNHEVTYGSLEDEGVCCFSSNTGLFSAFLEMQDVISVHCGHDHNNDFWGVYNNITLAYGRKTGYGGYGPPEGWLRGARVIELTENPFSMKMWIRQEDGSVVLQQPQNVVGTNPQYLCCDAVGSSVESRCDTYRREYRATYL